jgi:hypothetical protein
MRPTSRAIVLLQPVPGLFAQRDRGQLSVSRNGCPLPHFPKRYPNRLVLDTNVLLSSHSCLDQAYVRPLPLSAPTITCNALCRVLGERIHTTYLGKHRR